MCLLYFLYLGLVVSEGPLWVEQRRCSISDRNLAIRRIKILFSAFLFRRFALHTLRNFGFGKHGTERAIGEELDVLLTTLKASGRSPIDPTLPLHRAAANVISSLVFGERLAEDPRFDELSQTFSAQIIRNSGVSSNPLRTIFATYGHKPHFHNI